MKIKGFDKEIKGTLKQKTEQAVSMLNDIVNDEVRDVDGGHVVWDCEDDHKAADDILLCFVPVAVREAYKKVCKWYA